MQPQRQRPQSYDGDGRHRRDYTALILTVIINMLDLRCRAVFYRIIKTSIAIKPRFLHHALHELNALARPFQCRDP